MKSFYHPDVVAAISELSPEHQLRGLIDVLESAGGISLPWEGTAAGLRAILTAPGAVTRIDADKILGTYAVNCGRYLRTNERQGRREAWNRREQQDSGESQSGGRWGHEI